MVGKVVWFDVKKGFGFVREKSSNKDYFVHYSKIIASPGEFRVLEEGDEVEFDESLAERNGQKKPQAINVKITGGQHEANGSSGSDNTERGLGYTADVDTIPRDNPRRGHNKSHSM